ncbi:hypothetical protein [Flavobacterium sp.]|uniref:hypothetical protein n=1 Tax=Flavobacterium sp. TaxID=239 RepID=UPI00375055E6
MENHDKIYTQFKNAAEKSAEKDFPNKENVWDKIEGKLDQKVLKKETKLWKKIAVAASILLVVSVIYQFVKTDTKLEPVTNEVVINDSISKTATQIKVDSNAVVVTNSALKTNADEILKEQINVQSEIVSTDFSLATSETTQADTLVEKPKYNFKTRKNSSPATWGGNGTYEARGVKQIEGDEIIFSKDEVKEKESDKKLEAIVVIDGEVSKKKVADLDDEELESIVELKEPLYIINSIYYTEKELFGPNPTSPYAPLNKQKIETFSILQPEKATKIYGEKGKKGIVIVTTKDGKPEVKKE